MFCLLKNIQSHPSDWGLGTVKSLKINKNRRTRTTVAIENFNRSPDVKNFSSKRQQNTIDNVGVWFYLRLQISTVVRVMKKRKKRK